MKTIKQLRKEEGRWFFAGVLLVSIGTMMIHPGLTFALYGCSCLRISWETYEEIKADEKAAIG